MENEPSPYDDEFDIKVAFDRDRGHTAMLYTNGLDGYGFPELALEPPRWFTPPDDADWPQFTLFLLRALRTLAIAVFEADGDEVLPFVTSFEGKQVTFWFSEGAPRGPATWLFDEELSEMREVCCSLWSYGEALSSVI